MNKKCVLSIAIIVVIILIACFFVSCRDYSNYKSIDGYDDYISDNSYGNEYARYFGGIDAMVYDEDARGYFKKNSRRCGEYLITNYEDGVCINRYYGNLNEIHIPETLEDKPVIKLGGYLEKGNKGSLEGSYDSVSAFSSIKECVLYIPSTVKYISGSTLKEYLGYFHTNEAIADSPHIVQIHVDEDNPYYYSENGSLFTKNKKSLLFLNNTVSEYAVPNCVEHFIPINNIPYKLNELTFGNNIKSIDASVLDSEGCDISENYDESYYDNTIELPITVRGYKGTVAEDWAKKYYQKFIPLDK